MTTLYVDDPASKDKLSALPEPLVPADVDLRGMSWMPYYGDHLARSELNAAASDAVYRAAHNLWWAAWNNVPAASLPDDETALARFADLGRDVKQWRRLSTQALHGFVKCSDGRLYHKFLAPLAIDAWDRRFKQRERKRAWRGRNGAVPGTERDLSQGQNGDGTVTRSEDGTTDITRQDRTYSDTNVSGGKPPNGKAVAVDPVKDLWERGIALLGPKHRSLIGKFCKDYGQPAVLAAILECEAQQPVEPAAFLVRALEARAKKPTMPAYGAPGFA